MISSYGDASGLYPEAERRERVQPRGETADMDAHGRAYRITQSGPCVANPPEWVRAL